MCKSTEGARNTKEKMLMKLGRRATNKAICGAVMAAIISVSIELVGCGFSQEKIYTSSIFAMDTIMELQIAGREDYTPQAEETIRNIEKSLSVTDPESQIAKLNANGETDVDTQVSDIMTMALDVCKRTDGQLDVTIYPVLKAWGFTTGDYRVPTEEELHGLLGNVDYKQVQARADHLSIPDGFQVDLGSVAKGYTGSYVADELRELGVTSALLNLGGNVQCIGVKPNGDKWKVAVKSPFPDSATGMLGVVSADDVAIITSGGYERYFEEDGEIYWHILDPRTGKPARSGLASVTIIGKDGLLCDGLSTALFIKGLDEAVEFWKASDDFEAVFVTEDGEVYVTEGIAKDFSLTAEYSNAPLHVVSR